MSSRARHRVVFTIGSANVGGAEGQLTRLACELADRGHDVKVIFIAVGGPLTAALDAHGIPWVVARKHVPSSKGRRLVALLLLGWHLRHMKPGVIYTWLPGAVLPTVALARLVTRRARLIAAHRGEFDVPVNAVSARLFRWAYRRVDLATVNAPNLREVAVTWGTPTDRVRFIANGVDPATQYAHPRVQPPVAVVVSNFRSYKGHDVLVDALTRVTAPVVVRLMGEGHEREPTRLTAQARGVADRVVFVEHPAPVPSELAAAQFAIHPSRTEGLSNAILEQLAAGLPVVATDVGGTSLLVEDGVNGRLVPPGDAARLAEAIDALAGSPSLRAQMGAASLQHVQRFSWDVCVDAVEDVLDEAVRRRG